MDMRDECAWQSRGPEVCRCICESMESMSMVAAQACVTSCMDMREGVEVCKCICESMVAAQTCVISCVGACEAIAALSLGFAKALPSACEDVARHTPNDVAVVASCRAYISVPARLKACLRTCR